MVRHVTYQHHTTVPRAARPLKISEEAFYKLKAHGRDGRIALVRHALKMTQAEFGQAVGACRETVSHWENVDSRGEPRQAIRYRNAEAVAKIARSVLAFPVTGSAFRGSANAAWEALHDDQLQILDSVLRLATQLDQIENRLGKLSGAVAKLSGAAQPPPRRRFLLF
jgi:DNA-binding XRE family transcriptional regulator